MTLRAASVIDLDGTPASTYTPASSDTFSVLDLPAILEVNNGSGSSINVTPVDGTLTVNGNAAASITPTVVTAGQKQRFKVAPSYANSSGIVTVNFSATTSVTCEFYRF